MLPTTWPLMSVKTKKPYAAASGSIGLPGYVPCVVVGSQLTPSEPLMMLIVPPRGVLSGVPAGEGPTVPVAIAAPVGAAVPGAVVGVAVELPQAAATSAK